MHWTRRSALSLSVAMTFACGSPYDGDDGQFGGGGEHGDGDWDDDWDDDDDEHTGSSGSGSGSNAGSGGDDPGTTCNEANEDCAPSTCDGDSATMLPGSDCLSCHVRGEMDDDDEIFTAAGTVFEDGSGGRGAQGATVRITDADGAVIELTTNSAGNFYTSRPISMPYTAEVETSSGWSGMDSWVGDGGCASCHRCDDEGKLAEP